MNLEIGQSGDCMDDVDRFQARLLAGEAEAARELGAAMGNLANLIEQMKAWIDANSYLIDRRRYNRARRKAVRAILAGLSHEH